MRFHPQGPAIPDVLLERCDAGRVVFLCGAGVSIRSGMPDFIRLTQHVIEFFDPPANSEIMSAFRPWLSRPTSANTALDQIFNLLHLEYGKDEVNTLVTERLSSLQEPQDIGHEHGLIKRISKSQGGVPQIVTTNFDRLFELGQDGVSLTSHVPPAFPDLNFGINIEGVTYLHGRLVETDSESHPYVLSSADFGRAYLSEGWATNFIRQLLELYTVVLVGYQAEDPPIKYLLQGLNHDGQHGLSRLYAFDCGPPEEIEAKWRDRGVTAIAYSEHADLWASLEAWADRADDPRRWQASIIAKCQHDPKDMLAHERGQVAHILQTVQGARLFSEASPAPHPGWVCVMDADVRSGSLTQGYGDDAEDFDPRNNYGLDDDLRDITEDDRRQGISNNSHLCWRDGDDNPHTLHRLGGRHAKGSEPLPARLQHLANWISRSCDSPVLAWWAIRQNGLHPRLLKQFERQVRHSKILGERGSHIWNLILEHHRDPRNRQWNGDWFDLKSRINAEGWTASVLREFRRVASPRLEIKPPYGLKQSKPPQVCWEEILFSDLGHFEVALLDRHNEDLDVPEELLPQLFGIIEEQLRVASELMGDIETTYFQSPTCYPNREVEGREYTSNTAKVITWFVQLFDRMAVRWPELAHAHAMTWPASDQFFFRKLRLYALSKVITFEAKDVVKEILALDQMIFWDSDLVRELLFLLVDRWGEFTCESRNQLIDRILAGPNQPSHWSNEEFPRLRNVLAAKYARYLELQGCVLAVGHSDLLAKMIKGILEWNDSWATLVVIERGSQVGCVVTDETPDVLMSTPTNEVVFRAKEDLQRDFDSLSEKRPFTGLVKVNPRKALSALTIAGKSGDYPEVFWSSMINELPEGISPRLRRIFLNRVARLPQAVVAGLSHTLGRWLNKNLVLALDFDNDLAWAVYDHFVDSIQISGFISVKSSIGEVSRGGKVIQRSRRTYGHAINGPVGMCAQALFHAVPGEEQKTGSLIPDHIKSRIERLLTMPGEGADHAVSIMTRNLNWLMFVDPAWAEERIIPMLALDHPASEPAWNGFLSSGRVPCSQLTEIIKPLLLGIFPLIEGFSWDRDLLTVAAQWLGFMRVFHPNESSGLSSGEMRQVLRAMTDDNRSRFISWLGQVGQKNEQGWAQLIIPLINEDWPRERQYKTSSSARAWFFLLSDSGDNFPIVYEAVKRFLVPIEANNMSLYHLTLVHGDEQPITVLFPGLTLDLIRRVVPRVLSCEPYELTKVLALILETDPGLKSDSRYIHLIDLIERS